jgi:AcrR family transcriptional regulator
MKNTQSEKEKRPYLLRDERRRVFLEGAATLVETNGWGVLTMSALAEHIGVSRQLVYQHFPNLENLLVSTAKYLFRNVGEDLQLAVEKAQASSNVLFVLRAACGVCFDLPKGQGNALWQLISGTTLNLVDLEGVRTNMRSMLLDIWTPVLVKSLGMSDDQAKPLAWMLIMAFWGIRQLVVDQIMTREEAETQLNQMFQRVLQVK